MKLIDRIPVRFRIKLSKAPVCRAADGGGLPVEPLRMSVLPRIPTVADQPAGGVSPTSREVRHFLEQLQQDAGGLASVRTVALTAMDRPIDAVTLTDPSVSDDLKQTVLIVAGQHGNEESGRLVALRLMTHLLDDAQRGTLRKQKIVIMPNVNPDGAEADSYETPDGVRPNMDHGLDGPTTPEGRAVEEVAFELSPDVFVDMHARGHAGCSYDMVLYPQTKTYTEDDNTFHAIAADMVAAGERAGLPHISHPLAWWTEPPADVASTTAFAYRNFKSIVMLTESTEDNRHHYPRELTAKVGVARIMALLAWGNRRHPKQRYEGYPNSPVLGMNSRAMVPVGATAAARRRSRIDIWRHRSAVTSIQSILPEPPRLKTVMVTYDGPMLEHGGGVMIRAAGHRDVACVRWSGRELSPSDTDGFYAYRDEASTFVVAAAPVLVPGTWTVEVELI